MKESKGKKKVEKVIMSIDKEKSIVDNMSKKAHNEKKNDRKKM